MTELGIAPRVIRRNHVFPFKNRPYFDVQKWGGGFVPVSGAPGAVVIASGICCDIRTGRVYKDSRFIEGA